MGTIRGGGRYQPGRTAYSSGNGEGKELKKLESVTPWGYIQSQKVRQVLPCLVGGEEKGERHRVMGRLSAITNYHYIEG